MLSNVMLVGVIEQVIPIIIIIATFNESIHSEFKMEI